jgi:hypothetical protein
MARETAAQRELRLQAEREAYQAAFLAEYPQRLTRMVFEFATLWPMSRVQRYDDNSYVFMTEDTRSNWNTEWVLPDYLTVYQERVRDDLENAEQEVEAYKEYLAEQNRKADVRAEARRKAQELFTEEERELLGL